ncbi:MAG: M43 family zinc metalloprotease [Chitinophagales bacterium]|nr:fibronectin type III domain-containing protein [Bacteroidota bacterium]MCB9042600.1 fibronectin type III domain-containing protein [Chitinophagales bacterium]
MEKRFSVVLMFCILFLQFGNITATAQERCSTMPYYEKQLQEHPEYEINRQNIENFTESFIAKGGNTERVVYTIPVVFHVIYQNSTENISDAQVLSQLDILNEDFRRLNADASQTPSAFTGVAADTEIEFCLATIDPSGNPTTGIHRVATSTSTFSTNDNVKFTSSGGTDAWNSSQYLNIWICDLGSSLLGYAQFPGGPASTDGVVIHYKYTGNTGQATAPFNKGRTATHEVGHYLNLYHIWGDDGTSCTGSDSVADTPNQADENYGCPTHPSPSCSNSGDMFMNYMDYTDDACMNMFTAGQKTRIQSLFASGGARVSLLSSPACSSSGSCSNAPAAPSLSSPSNGATGQSTVPTLSWGAVTGTDGATSYTVQVSTVSNFSTTVVNQTGITTTSYTLTTTLSENTTYYWRVRGVNDCGTGSWSSVFSFTTLSCTTPTNLTSSSIGVSSASITWSAVSGASAYNVRIKPTASSTWTTSSTTSTSVNVSSLTACTEYEVQVQTDCGNGSTSAWTASYVFTTTGCSSGGETCNDYLVNGDFELGVNNGWSESSSNNYQIVDNTSGYYYDGAWSAWLGGANNENSQIWQSVTIPATATTATLTYYYYITSGSTNCNGDVAYLKINGSNLITYGLCQSNQTANYTLETVDLLAYAGQTIEIRFQTTTNNTNASSFFVDGAYFNICIPGNCPASYNFVSGTDDYLSGETNDYETDGIITANNTVGLGATITYDCGIDQYVSLQNGFFAQYGSNFTAFPDGCGNLKLNSPKITPLNQNTKTFATKDGAALQMRSEAAELTAIPNPSDNTTVIWLQSEELPNEQLEVYSLEGRLIERLPIKTEQRYITLPTDKYAPGVYFIKYSSNSFVKTLKLVVQH